jgi:hypothetical protein
MGTGECAKIIIRHLFIFRCFLSGMKIQHSMILKSFCIRKGTNPKTYPPKLTLSHQKYDLFSKQQLSLYKNLLAQAGSTIQHIGFKTAFPSICLRIPGHLPILPCEAVLLRFPFLDAVGSSTPFPHSVQRTQLLRCN